MLTNSQALQVLIFTTRRQENCTWSFPTNTKTLRGHTKLCCQVTLFFFFPLVLFLKNATQYHGSTKIFPYFCKIAHPNNEACKRSSWGNISLVWLPSIDTGTEHVLALEHCWLLNVHLYGNVGCRLRAQAHEFCRTCYRGDPFLLTPLLSSNYRFRIGSI